MNGWGKPEASIWLIVERPDTRADLAGRAAQDGTLDHAVRLLHNAGIDPTNVFLTYLAKCACKDKGDVGYKESIKLCPPAYLELELQQYKPKIILICGTEVTRNLLKLPGSVAKNRGKLFDLVASKAMVTYSPAVLYGDKVALGKDIERDMKLAYEIATGQSKHWTNESIKNLDYKLIDSFKEWDNLLESIKEHGTVAFDTECRKLNPHKKWEDGGFGLVSIQFSTHEGHGRFLPIAHISKQNILNSQGLYWDQQDWERIKLDLKKIFETGDIKIVAQNAKFDIKWLKLLNINAKLSFDIMLASSVLGDTSLGLKKMAWEQSDLGGYDEEQAKYTNSLPEEEQWDMFKYPLDMLCTYGCADADVTLRVYNKLKVRLEKKSALGWVNNLLTHASRVFADVEFKGMHIDESYLEQLSKELEMERSLAETEFRLATSRYITMVEEDLLKAATNEKTGKVSKTKATTFNINSSDHLRSLLFEKIGLPVNEDYISEKTGDPSVGKMVLEGLVKRHTAVTQLLKVRKLSKLISGFTNAYPQFIINSYIHPEYGLVKAYDDTTDKESGTRTGRLSCSNPNAQNIPSRGDYGKRIKKLFIPDTSEHVLADLDYSGIEIRVTAALCQDQSMIQFINTGTGDFHRFVASKVYGKLPDAITDDERTVAKTTAFCTLFGGSANKVAALTGLTEKKAKEFIEEYFNVFPGLKKWITQQKAFVTREGYCKTIFGRIRSLPEARSQSDSVREGALRRGINTPVQSAASDLMLYSLFKIHKYLSEYPHTDIVNPSRIIASIHDSVVLSIHIDDMEVIIPRIKHIMENPTLDVWNNLGVKLKADVAVGKSWGEVEEIDV